MYFKVEAVREDGTRTNMITFHNLDDAKKACQLWTERDAKRIDIGDKVKYEIVVDEDVFA